jgi:P4 family phage/plasmid primase-like protien
MIDLAAVRSLVRDRAIGESDVGDVSLSRMLLDDIAAASGGTRPVATRGSLYAYNRDSGTWCEIRREEALSLVQAFDGVDLSCAKKNRDGEWESYTKPLRLSASKCRGMVDCALTNPDALDSSFFDDVPAGVAFQNGFATVTADGIAFETKSPKHKALACVPYDYDPEAECHEWNAITRRVFELEPSPEDMRKLLQEFAGAAVAGIAHQYAKCLILSGGGNNGKSVVAEMITDHLMPDGSVSFTTPQSWARPEYLSRLRSARLNVANEVPANDIQASDVFKAVIDGGAVTARDLYAQPYTLKPRAAHLFLCNELPGTRDHSNGFWRRVFVLRFKRNFSTHPDETGRLRTKDEVKSTLKAELPGIMLWALHGAVRLLRQGAYTVPPSHAEEMAEWKLETDQVAAFVDDCCINDGGSTLLADVHKEFLEWCELRRRTPLSDRSLAKRLRSLGIEQTRGSAGYRMKMTVMMKGSWGTKAVAS